jgi:hypothetical protein
MDVWCVCLFCVCDVLYLGRGLATSWSLAQGVLPSVKWSWNWKAEARAKGAVDPVKKKSVMIKTWRYRANSVDNIYRIKTKVSVLPFVRYSFLWGVSSLAVSPCLRDIWGLFWSVGACSFESWCSVFLLKQLLAKCSNLEQLYNKAFQSLSAHS